MARYRKGVALPAHRFARLEHIAESMLLYLGLLESMGAVRPEKVAEAKYTSVREMYFKYRAELDKIKAGAC